MLASFLRRALPAATLVVVAIVGAGDLCAQATPVDSAGRDTVRPRALAPVTVTGTRLAPAAGAGGARVDAASLRVAPGPAALATALARLPGVSLFDDQGTRAQPTLVVRGFTLSPVVGVPQGVSVFLDGVRVNEADAQQVHFDLLPFEAIDRAELTRGPSVLFGKNTLAGALNLVTRRGDAVPHAEATLEAGPFGHRGARAAGSGMLGSVDAYATAHLSREDGWRDVTAAVRRGAFATVGMRGDAGDIALSVLVAHDSLEQAGSLPESWLASRRRANFTGGDFYAPRLLHLALRGERALGAAADGAPAGADALRGNLWVRGNRSQQFNVNAGAASTRARIGVTTAGGTLELSRAGAIGALPLALTAGVEASRSGVRYRVFQEASGDAGPDPAGCDVRGDAGLCENARVVADDAAAYLQAVLRPAGRVAVTLAARADWVRVPFEDLREPDNSATSLFRRVSPRAAVRWQATPALALHASAGAGFRAPAALELACADEDSPCPLPFSLGDDPPLAPVRVRTIEIGADREVARVATLSASAYATRVRDEIVLVTSERTAGFFRNLALTRRAGVELQGAVRGPAGTSAQLSYAWTRATYGTTATLASAREDADSVRPGDRIPLVPAHRATAALAVARTIGAVVVDGELAVTGVSTQFLRGDEANEARPLAGYGLAGVRLRAAWRHLAATVHVANLLDRRYETFGIWGENALAPDGSALPGGERVERFLTPGYPRTITVGLSLAR